MSVIILIAGNTIRAILSRAALYVWAGGALLAFLRAGPAIFMRSDNEEMLRLVRANTLGGVLDMWAWGCIAAAMVLGGLMVAGDLTTKRAVTVLSRPVRRWEFLAGTLAGVVVFLAVTLALGVALGLATAAYLDVEVNNGFLRYGIAQTLAAIVLLGGVSVAIGSFGSAMGAFALALALVILPDLVDTLREHTNASLAATGRVLDVLTPEQPRSHFGAATWVEPPGVSSRPGMRRPAGFPVRPALDVADERLMLAGNLGYAAVYFLLGCAAFSRRDLSLH